MQTIRLWWPYRREESMETTQNAEMQIKYGGYKGFKAKFDFVMNKTASYFVEIGQMLKEARDTDILSGSGYTGMGEFAAKEYGLRPDQTSRFTAIAEKFGDGRGDLLPEYASHGYTKLSEMLTLPDAVAEAIPPELSREDIRAIKDEIQKEKDTTPLEVMMEGTPEEDELKAMLRAYFEGRPEEAGRAKGTEAKHDPDPGVDLRGYVLEALAPTGIGVLQSRPEGMGRVLLSFGGLDRLPLLTIVRRDECRDVAWPTVWYAMCEVLREMRIPEPKNETPEPVKDEKLKIAPAQMNPPEQEEKSKQASREYQKNAGEEEESEKPYIGSEKQEEKPCESSEEPEKVFEKSEELGSDASAEEPGKESEEEAEGAGAAPEAHTEELTDEKTEEKEQERKRYYQEWRMIREEIGRVAVKSGRLRPDPSWEGKQDLNLIGREMKQIAENVREFLEKYKNQDTN